MSALSNILSTYLQRSRSEGVPLSQIKPEDAAIYTSVRPKIKPVRTKETLPSAKLYDAVADVSVVLRNIPVALSEIFGRTLGTGGAPLVGLTSLLYCVIGIGRARDSYLQKKDYVKIGDTTGANLARAQIVENSVVAGGSAALAVVRSFSFIQELFQLLEKPITFSPVTATVLTVATVVSTVLYSLFYAIFVARQVIGLKHLSDGNELREKLLSSKDPIEALRQHIDLEMFKGSGFTKEECIEMALQEGVVWLEKLEKEMKDFSWDPTEESRREHVYMLLRNNPEFMMAEMGVPRGFDKLSPEGRIVRFGQFIGTKRLSAKIENDLKRQLGSEVVEALDQKTPDPAALVKALKSADWSEWGVRWKTVAKIILGIACAAGVIAGTVFTGGLALGIALLILGVSGAVWIALTDGSAFKSQVESGEVRKWDKFLVYFSVALSVLAIGTLIAMTVLSGGSALFIAGIIFTAGWLVINGQALYMLRNPWKYQKEVSIQTFRKFLETQRSNEEIEKVYNKMTLADRAGIEKIRVASGSYRKAAEVWEKHLKELREESLEILMERLDEASETVQQWHQNVVAI